MSYHQNFLCRYSDRSIAGYFLYKHSHPSFTAHFGLDVVVYFVIFGVSIPTQVLRLISLRYCRLFCYFFCVNIPTQVL